MLKSKKILALIIATTLLSTFSLVGCGTKKVSEDNNKQELKEVKLSWYTIAENQPDQEAVFAAFNKKLKEKINATVEFNFVGQGTYGDKMKIITAGGEDYDICFTSNWLNDYATNASKGAYKDLDELLPKYAPELQKALPDFYWKGIKVNGKTYGIPNQQIVARQPGIGFQKEVLDKLGYKADSFKTPESVEPYVKDAYEKLGIKTSGFGKDSIVAYGYTLVGPTLGNSGIAVKLDDSDLKATILSQTDMFKKWLDANYSWSSKGYTFKETVDFQATMKAKKISTTFPPTVKPGGDAELSGRYGWDYVSTPIGQPIINSVLDTMNAISSNSKNPERALMLLNLMSTDKDLYNTLCYGIEGTHYTKTGENRIEVAKDTKYKPGMNWALGNTFNAYLIPGQPDDVWQQTDKLNKTAKTSPVMGFVFNPDAVKVEIANVASIDKEFEPLFYGWINPAEYYSKYIDKLKAGGIEKIQAEVQKQLNEFKANKK